MKSKKSQKDGTILHKLKTYLRYREWLKLKQTMYESIIYVLNDPDLNLNLVDNKVIYENGKEKIVKVILTEKDIAKMDFEQLGESIVILWRKINDGKER